ncbi:hypothetical protein ACK350_13595, partial [Aeromonas veronii]
SDATVCCCGSGILLNRLLESSLIFKCFSRLSTWLSALPLALSMEAHYREQILSGKAKLHVFLIKLHNRSNNKQKEENSN